MKYLLILACAVLIGACSKTYDCDHCYQCEHTHMAYGYGSVHSDTICNMSAAQVRAYIDSSNVTNDSIEHSVTCYPL